MSLSSIKTTYGHLSQLDAPNEVKLVLKDFLHGLYVSSLSHEENIDWDDVVPTLLLMVCKKDFDNRFSTDEVDILLNKIIHMARDKTRGAARVIFILLSDNLYSELRADRNIDKDVKQIKFLNAIIMPHHKIPENNAIGICSSKYYMTTDDLLIHGQIV